MSQKRWSPTLPSFGGRLCPRVTLPEGYPSDYCSKLERFYLERSSSSSIFVKRVDVTWLKAKGHSDQLFQDGEFQAPNLGDLEWTVLYKYLMSGISQTMSLNFQRKLSDLCRHGKIGTIKRWYQTVDGLVLPLLLSVEDPDLHYVEIDKLIKFGFENCANNYSHFISRMKSVKRLLRKDYALDSESAKGLTDVSTYRKIYLRFFPSGRGVTHADEIRYVLIWSQTRASGLADEKMCHQSLNKCEITLSTPRRPRRIAPSEERAYGYRGLPLGEPVVPKIHLSRVCERIANRLRGETAHLSAGPNACLESTRQEGGQTGYVSRVCKSKSLHTLYDFRTLVPTTVAPRPVRSQDDLLSWAIQETLEHPTYVRCVRLHSVAEPSKARTITVCTLPYLLIVGVLSKLLQPAIASDISRAGLHASRNLWKFLYEDLDPGADLWFALRDQFKIRGQISNLPILALSSDLSEATDYGDLGVARQILAAILHTCCEVPGFPTGLAQLAKTLFVGKRFCLRSENGRYRFFVKRNGWLMGDRLTKVILTLSHEIALRESGLYIARICGDDVIAFSRSRSDLERYHQVVTDLGFKVSEEDHYISSKLAFYCEEACIPPTTYRELPQVAIRRKTGSIYIDYPRIRLLIPTCVETHAHSYTDIGRFSLLGRETRWVYQNGAPHVAALFKRASLLQHIHVPRTSDTMCPFTPLQIGGDDSFPFSGEFLEKVVSSKARNSSETRFRMSSLMTGKWGYRLVRNANLDNVVHKYHTLVPKLKELRNLLPEHAILEGNQFLLNSIKIDGVESPERTFFRIWRAWYWHQILQGFDPPELILGVRKEANLPQTEVNIDFEYFFHVWKDLGFTFENVPDYLVSTKDVHVLDYMNMGWWFGTPPIGKSAPDLDDIGGRFLLNEENIESFINHVKDNRELSPVVRSTIYKYVESDSYIKWEFSKRSDLDSLTRIIFLVSSDLKLGAELARMARSRYSDNLADAPVVVVVPCWVYSFGMMDIPVDWSTNSMSCPDPIVIVDQGSLTFDQMVNSPEFSFFDKPRVTTRWYRSNPWLGTQYLDIVEDGTTPSEVWSLTTQHPSQWRPGHFPYVPLRQS